ncbi:MAG: putative periplasmic protein [Myxococcales bacterium]|nr:putative periplasmic protein [Myxococcales bacterium]
MTVRHTCIALALAAALLGCDSGCDGERSQRPVTPRPRPVPAIVDDGGAAIEVPTSDGEVAYIPGTLDAPAGTLDQLFIGLDAAERADPTGRVLLLFFGDSHTAGDSMTSRLRTTFQSRFGDAGRGLVAAGRPPTRHYYQRDVLYGTSGTWKAAVGGHRGDPEPYGISGIRVYGQQKGAQLWVETCLDCQAGTRVSQLEILYYSAPDHGLLRYRVDEGAWQQLSTKTAPIEPPHPARQVIPVVDGPHKLTLEHGGGGPVDLFGVVMERGKPGAIVDSLGVVGRRLGSLRSWDWSIIGDQLSTRDPRLVVLQYGTNEADDPDLDLEAMARYFDDTILRIRAAAPTASILILGPPDLGVREAGKSCDRMQKQKAAIDAGVIPECEWRTPGVLGEIISVEHSAAVRNKVAFFDTFAAMGGPDQMQPWVLAEPKVAYKDHVHFTDVGYQRWADALSQAVLVRYADWRRAQNMPPTKPIRLPPPVKPSDAPLPGSVEPVATPVGPEQALPLAP